MSNVYSSAYFRNPNSPNSTTSTCTATGDNYIAFTKADNKFRLQLYGLIVALFAVNILVTGIVSGYVSSQVAHLTHVPDETMDWRLCTRCSLADTTPDGSRLAQRSGELCCTANQEQFWSTIKNLSSKIIEKASSENGSFLQQALHLYLQSNTCQKNKKEDCETDSENSPINGWSDASDTAFKRDGINYNNVTGTFRITSYGLYAVYSNLAFFCMLERCNESKITAPIYKHWIAITDMNGAERIPLTDKRLRLMNSFQSSDSFCYNSKLFGVITLDKNDTVKIFAKPHCLISRANKQSYVGIYKLWQ